MSKEIIDFYDLNNENWANLLDENTNYLPHQKAIAVNLLNSLGSENSSIIDVGCGAGQILTKIYPNYKFLKGIDISESMLNHAKKLKKISNLNEKKITFEEISFKNFLNENNYNFDVFSFIGYFVHHENSLSEHLYLLKNKFMNLSNVQNKKVYIVASFKNKLFGLYAINQRSRELFKEISDYSLDYFKSKDDQNNSFKYFHELTKNDFKSEDIEKEQYLNVFKGEHVLEEVIVQFEKYGYEIEKTQYANPHSLPPSMGEGEKAKLTNLEIIELTNNIQEDWRSQFTCSMFYVVASINL